jgi:CRP-like cAMP-binding protein
MIPMNDYESLAIKIRQTDLLSEEEIEVICNHFYTKVIPKNKFFIESGNRCSHIGFLLSGILCSFIYSEEGEEVVKYFVEPDQFFTDLESYEHSHPAKLNIQSVIDSKILYISKCDNQDLQSQIPAWGHVLSIFSSSALNKMIQTQNFLHFGTAREKYRYFVQHHPNLARHVPLKFIASFLGITQSSLSRLRREKE